MSLLLLFIAAFGAATLLPLQSEAVLVGFFIQNHYSVWLLIAIASIGNILGSCVNWWLGLKMLNYQNKKWFPVSQSKMHQAQKIYQKYGFWSLLLSWVPVIGDPVTLIAGFFKENFLRFFLLVSLAKCGRYTFIYFSYLGLSALSKY